MRFPWSVLQPAAAQSGGSDVPREVINGVIQNIVQSVRDQIYRRRVAPPPGALRSQFSGEASDFDSRNPFADKGMSDPFSALAYAKSPYTKAPATRCLRCRPGSTASIWSAAATVGDTLGVVTHVATVTGAFDVTKIGVFTATDALTFIGTGSHSWSRAEAQLVPAIPVLITDATIPSASGTLSYLNGGFSADFTALASWVRSSTNQPLVVVPDSSSISYTGNAQYRFDLPYSFWFEPTAGVTYTEIYTANFGIKLLDTTEVHGGARVGTEMKWMGYTVQPTISGTVFRVVAANVGAIVPGQLVGALPPDLLGGRGSGKITVLWTPNFSSYLEVHGSGTAGTKTVPFVNATQVYGAQGGLRYTF